jgi:AbrB family looped-hinge helix DNA binding protein
MTTTLSSKGQVVLPAELRRKDDIRPGERFEIERIDRGEYRLTRLTRCRNAGLVNLLLACPAKGRFRPLARTETTDDVPTPGRR